MTQPTDKHREWANETIAVFSKDPRNNFEIIAERLAAFEAEVTGWRTDMENAPRDKNIDLFVKSTESGSTMRLADCWYSKPDGDWCWYHGVLHKIHKNYVPIAWCEITLPAQPEKGIKDE